MAPKKGFIPWNKGLVGIYSDATKEKMSFWKGKKMPAVIREKMRLAARGRKASEASRIRMSIAQRARRKPNWDVSCKVCSRTFEVVFSRKDKATYCSRKCFKIGRTGATSPLKGKFRSTTYGACHYKVRIIRGTPSKCEVCGTTVAKKFEWANMTGHYEDVNDYKRMCASCHDKHDEVIKNITGIDVGGTDSQRKAKELEDEAQKLLEKAKELRSSLSQ